MEHTTNYNLPQWEENDRITRDDVNGAMSAIDTALGTKAGIVFGFYYGDGVYPREINVGFKPRAVLLMHRTGRMYVSDSEAYGGLFGQGSPYDVGPDILAEVTDTGFRLVRAQTNKAGHRFTYIAFQ